MLRLPVPDTPEDVTPDWLTAALNEGGLRVGRVADAQWIRVGAEYGFTGLVGRVRLRYDGAAAGSPRSVIVKLPTAHGDGLSGYRTSLERDPALLRRHYERCVREARFYRELSVPIAPRLYYAGVDDERRRVALVLEDVRGRQGDVLHGWSVADATLVLDELTPFHARWWGQPARRSGFPRLVGDPQARQARYERQVDRFLEEHGGGLPPAVSSICERLRSRLAAVAASLTAGHRTLLHADLHLDNMIFDGRGGGRSVVVLDWQTVSVGPPAWDVALFLFGSLNAEDRRVAEPELLGRYVARLSAHGVRRYSVEELRFECGLALLLLLAGTVGWLAGVDPGESTARERALQHAALADGRLVAALLDHDVEALLAELPRESAERA